MLKRLTSLTPAVALLVVSLAGPAEAGMFRKSSCCASACESSCGAGCGDYAASTGCDACGGYASGGCAECGGAVAGCGVEGCGTTMVTKTVMTPTYVTEMRTVMAHRVQAGRAHAHLHGLQPRADDRREDRDLHGHGPHDRRPRR